MIGKQFLTSAHNKQVALMDARFALLFVVPLSIHLKCSLTNQTRNQFLKSTQCFDIMQMTTMESALALTFTAARLA